MKTNVNNKAFSLVELIIVFSAMAVLVGVMAPQYIKYLEKTKKTDDCSAISNILDACEVLALDPNTEWDVSDPINITIQSTGTTYLGGASTSLNDIVPSETVVMQSKNWGVIEIVATKNIGGTVEFEISDDTQKIEFSRYSPAVAERLE